MSPNEFEIIAGKIRPFTDYIYLHILGEPLLHPQLDEILNTAGLAGLNINITTNGRLLEQKKEILLKHTVRQINISLHDAEENIPVGEWESFLDSVFEYAEVAADRTYVNLRLWNSGVASSQEFNRFVLERIGDRYHKSMDELTLKGKDTGVKLAPHVFLQTSNRFVWPDGEETRSEPVKTCYALRDQVAVLVDGTVVPCCLDADGNLKLGNIFEEELDSILKSERAQRIRNGFINNKIKEDFCRSCGFFI